MHQWQRIDAGYGNFGRIRLPGRVFAIVQWTGRPEKDMGELDLNPDRIRRGLLDSFVHFSFRLS